MAAAKRKRGKPTEEGAAPTEAGSGSEAEILDQGDFEDIRQSEGMIDLTGARVSRDSSAEVDDSKEPDRQPKEHRSKALSTRDPLAVYMRDVQRYRLLTPDEEHDLAVRYVEDGDVDAARRLVTSNLRLVVKIAYDYRRAYKNLLDLIQEGNIGLMQAVKKYDPYKGVKLSSYAAWWIRAYMLRYILNTHRLVKLGTTQAQRKLFFNLKKEKARLSAMGIEPTPERIASELSVPKEDVIQMDRRLAAGDASLDAPVGADDGRQVARVELLPGSSSPIDDTLASRQLGEMFGDQLRSFGESLEGKERVIFDKRLIAEDPQTLQELGNGFGVSRERVRQLEKRLLQKLKQHLTENLGPGVVGQFETQ